MAPATEIKTRGLHVDDLLQRSCFEERHHSGTDQMYAGHVGFERVDEGIRRHGPNAFGVKWHDLAGSS